MVVASSHKDPVVVDFVLVVEATANMVAHWDNLKKSYILPAIEYFNGRMPSAVDYIGNHGSSQFSYVLFHSADTSEMIAGCSRTTNSPWSFIQGLDNISFNGGGSERFSLVAEGLGKALQLFDDLSHRRGPGNNARKVCVLVCNSPPYDLPCQESLSYSGCTSEKLAELMGAKGIHLSVISPQLIQPLRKLYLAANQNKPPNMYCAQDARHLVHVSGFQLPTERDPSKLNQNGEQKQPAINSGISSSIVTSSVPSPAQHLSPASSQTFGLNATNSPVNLLQTTSSATAGLSGLTDSIGSSAISSQTINGIVTNQAATSTQAATAQVSGITVNSPATMIQTSQQPQMSQQHQMLDSFSSMSNSSGGMPPRTSSLFSRPSMNSSDTAMAPSNGTSNLKDMLRPTQPQILLSSTSGNFGGQADDGMSNNTMAGMSGTIQGTNSQGQFTSSHTGLQGIAMNNQQQPQSTQQQQQQQQRLVTQAIGQRNTMSASATSGIAEMRGNSQLPAYSNTSAILNNTAQGAVSYNSNQQTQQQMIQANQQANRVGQVRPNITQNFTNQPAVSGQQMTSQMMNQVQMNQPQIGQQQNGIMNNVGVGQQSSVDFLNNMGTGQQSQNSTVTTSFQMARQVAESVMKQAEMTSGVNQPNNQRSWGGPGGIQTNMPTQGFAGQQQPQQAPNEPPRMVWSGTLEWTEKRKVAQGVNPQRTVHNLMCEVYLQSNHTDDSIGASTWPSKLTMQLIPHIVFTSMHSQVKNNRTVSLRMPSTDEVQALATIMKNKWIGLIQIPTQNPRDNKVMLVIYSQKKMQFFGLLPLDPQSFITTIRQVIAKHQPQRPQMVQNPQSVVAQQQPQMNMGMDSGNQSGMMQQFSQDNVNKQQNQQGQTNQYQITHNPINPRANTTIRTGTPIQQNATLNQGGMRTLQSSQGVPVQSSLQVQSGMQNQQRLDMNFRQQMPSSNQMTNPNVMMAQQQQQTQQQVTMGQPQIQQSSNPNQFIYSNINQQQQRNMVGVQPGMEQTIQRQQQLHRVRLQHQQQQVQRNNMQSMNQIGGNHSIVNSDHEQLRNLLQPGNMGQNMNTQQRSRMPMMNTGMRQAPQTGLRPAFMQNQQVHQQAMQGNRMMGMQQQQRFNNMQQNQQQPPMI